MPCDASGPVRASEPPIRMGGPDGAASREPGGKARIASPPTSRTRSCRLTRSMRLSVPQASPGLPDVDEHIPGVAGRVKRDGLRIGKLLESGRVQAMRFGVYLPPYAWADMTCEQAARVKTFACQAEDLGFDALWVAEHFLVAPGLYGTVWMSPLLCLAHAASVTSRIRLATGLLIVPYYHPVRWPARSRRFTTSRTDASCSAWDRAGTSASSRRSA